MCDDGWSGPHCSIDNSFIITVVLIIAAAIITLLALLLYVCLIKKGEKDKHGFTKVGPGELTMKRSDIIKTIKECYQAIQHIQIEHEKDFDAFDLPFPNILKIMSFLFFSLCSNLW